MFCYFTGWQLTQDKTTSLTTLSMTRRIHRDRIQLDHQVHMNDVELGIDFHRSKTLSTETTSPIGCTSLVMCCIGQFGAEPRLCTCVVDV